MLTFKKFIDGKKFTPVVGTQYGSNSGGLYKHNDSNELHYIKHYANPEQGRVEALTSKIYEHMGIKTVNPDIGHVNNKEAVISKWNDKLKSMHPRDFHLLNNHQADQIGKMYHAAILTKNWDIIGLTHDNVMKNSDTGDIHAIDHGGAFHFRARGGPKTYGPDIDEHHSLRYNSQASGQVFSSVFKSHPTSELAGLEAVKNIDDAHVHSLFEQSGISNWKDLHQNFMQRKNALLEKYKER